MKYRREIVLADGNALLLRSLGVQDAEETIRVCRKTAGETLNLIRYEDEWTITPEQERAHIRSMENNPKALMLGAYLRGEMVGVASFAPPASVDRARHRANLGVTILKSCWGRGIGKAMMQALIEQAKTTAIEQLELEVVGANERAIRLYEQFGFEVFARHPRKLKYRDGTYADMLLMMLDLQKVK